MPELGEVEFYRRVWDEGLKGRVVRAAQASGKRPFRGGGAPVARLVGTRLIRSLASGKQLLFEFSGGKAGRVWVGVHLGMTGDLRVEPATFKGGRHDHLILRTAHGAGVYTDPRMFGRIDIHARAEPPAWWLHRPADVLSAGFSRLAVAAYLKRRRRSPLKAVVLDQERFPGVGNWMADEILWRARLHPARLAGSLTATETESLWRECRWVCRAALDRFGARGRSLPPSPFRIPVPPKWLLGHRWAPGGKDPLTGSPLRRATIGGRTTVWSPGRQKRN
ncbi:MAG TPA: DNA-formamidopyrimidine glycosylase family protein [Opitutaceae bacterium]|jgi:formamidopyrimidine-DNA glycosylase